MPDQTEWMKLYEQMPDGGPIYSETNLSNTFAEPWNALSSLTFLLPAFYWGWQIRHSIRKNIFLLCCCVLLSIGGIGSTLFHAFRKFPILLMMDVFPIILLTIVVSSYFWLKLLPKWWLIIPILVPAFALRYWVMKNISSHEAINVGYFISGTLIFLPLLILLIKTKYIRWADILLAVSLLSLALVFRKIDSFTPPLLFMGTHWLWHLFCAAGAYFLGNYIYQIENVETLD
jgi:hypothetical protein